MILLCKLVEQLYVTKFFEIIKSESFSIEPLKTFFFRFAMTVWYFDALERDEAKMEEIQKGLSLVVKFFI